MVSEAPFFLGLSVWGLFMAGNCSRTWLVTTSRCYGNSSLTPLKIDPLHPWDRKKIKENRSRGGPVCSAAGPQMDFEVQRCSSWGPFNCPPKSRKGWGSGGGRSTLLAFSRQWGHWRRPCPDLVCLLLYRLNHRS